MPRSSCFLCDVLSGESQGFIVWSDAEFVALLDRYPITTGHVVLAPRLHLDSVFDLPDDLYVRLFAHARTLAAAVSQAFGSPRTGLAIEGFGVPHAHLHLVPVWQGNDLDPCRQTTAATDEELRQAADRLHEVLVGGARDG